MVTTAFLETISYDTYKFERYQADLNPLYRHYKYLDISGVSSYFPSHPVSESLDFNFNSYHNLNLTYHDSQSLTVSERLYYVKMLSSNVIVCYKSDSLYLEIDNQLYQSDIILDNNLENRLKTCRSATYWIKKDIRSTNHLALHDEESLYRLSYTPTYRATLKNVTDISNSALRVYPLNENHDYFLIKSDVGYFVNNDLVGVQKNGSVDLDISGDDIVNGYLTSNREVLFIESVSYVDENTASRKLTRYDLSNNIYNEHTSSPLFSYNIDITQRTNCMSVVNDNLLMYVKNNSNNTLSLYNYTISLDTETELYTSNTECYGVISYRHPYTEKNTIWSLIMSMINT